MNDDIFKSLGLNLNRELVDSLLPAEKEAVFKILHEMSGNGGLSDSYKELINQDYEEIPVDIDTFIEDDRYIGKVTDNGKTIYPYWRNVLRKIFNPENNYSEIIFTGAIGLGKTTIAITGMAYILYQLLCLRNPQEFYKLQGNSEIVIAFFNVNLDLSYGVAFKKMQTMLMDSPWFLEHGKIYGRQEKNKQFIPDKKIRFRVGSQENHGLGQDIFCVTRDTIISTINGDIKIEDLNNSVLRVYSLDDKNKLKVSNECLVKQTGIADTLYHIALEDGTVLKCTKDHMLQLVDGTYKKVEDLTIYDEIQDLECLEN